VDAYSGHLFVFVSRRGDQDLHRIEDEPNLPSVSYLASAFQQVL
jgi:hypothetical protein